MIKCKECAYWGQSIFDCWTTDMRFCKLMEENKSPDMINMGSDDEYNLHIETHGDFGCILGVNK